MTTAARQFDKTKALARVRNAGTINVLCLVFATVAAFVAPGVAAGIIGSILILFTTSYSIHIAIGNFHSWRRARDPEDEPPYGPGPLFFPLLFALVTAIVVGAAIYITAFVPQGLSPSGWIEGLNYSVQTVTTVGYGNWTPEGIPFSDPRLLGMKAFSIVLMLDGVTVWSIIIGMLAGWFASPTN